MTKSKSKKQLPAPDAETAKQAATQQTPAEKLAMKKARAAFAKQAHIRGEVAATDEVQPPRSALFTESADGELTRHRFSLIPESLLPPEEHTP